MGLVAGPVATAVSAPAGTITEFTDDAIADPWGITTGPDGNLWFANKAGPSIGRMTPSGTLTTFDHVDMAAPEGITVGPDGNLWFTDNGNNSIGRITPTGDVTMFTHASVDYPTGITTGPDGNLWFTNYEGHSVGRITPAGAITELTDDSIYYPEAIVAGPDGNLWFTNNGNSSIGRMTPAGVVTPFSGEGIDNPYGITAGPDGNLWFTNYDASSIGRITPTGVVTAFSDPDLAAPSAITVGSDGNLWFTNVGDTSIGRITPTGTVTVFPDPTIAGPSGIASGPDGGLWFTNYSADSIGRLDFGSCSAGSSGPFTDVPATSQFCTPIEWMVASGIASGYADGSFRPGTSVSRQAMASFLYKYSGQPAITLTTPYFADVPAGHPFYWPIQWMAESGLSTGSPNPAGGKPLYKPADTVTRQAMAAFLWRNADQPGTELTEPFFADVPVGHPFTSSVQWMAETGLSTGTPNPPGKPLYKPTLAVSRQALAAFLFRYDALG